MDCKTVTLPSRAQVDIRPIRIAEENKLASAAKGAHALDRALEEVLSACVPAVVDPGPYGFLEVGSRPDWRRMLSGDRFVAMIELRKISYRDGHLLYAMDLACPGGRCPRFDYMIDLDRELVRRDLDDEAYRRVAAGEPFEATIAARRVTFQLGTGQTEETAKALRKQHPARPMACLLRARLLDVEGVERRDILDWIDGNNLAKAYPGLSSQDGEDLRDALDRAECGIDTEVDIRCEHCGSEYAIDLPFDSGFLLPGTEIRRRRRDRKASATSSSAS